MMRKRILLYPWWGHLPILAVLGAVLYKIVAVFPRLPARVPVHFNFTGVADRFGTRFELALGLAVPLLVMAATGIIFAELYARFEREKGINWVNLIPAALLGFFAATIWNNLDSIASGGERFFPPWRAALPAALGTAAVYMLVEVLRPYNQSLVQARQYSGREEDYAGLIREQMRKADGGAEGARAGLLYLEGQDPLWMRLVLAVIILGYPVLGAFTFAKTPAVSIVLWVLAPLLSVLYGGLQLVVTGEEIRVKLGIYGIQIRRVRLAEITAARVREFNPLKDFGGWGIRRGWDGTTAYFFRGAAGVQLNLKNGKKILIGSDNPERLAAVVQALMGGE